MPDKTEQVYEIPGDELHKACELLALVPIVSGHPESAFIGVTGKKETTLSLSSTLSVAATLPIPRFLRKGLSLDRRILIPFVRPGGVYKIRDKGDRLSITHGRRRCTLQPLPVEWSYGQWEGDDAESFQLPEGCHDILGAARLAAEDDPMTPQLNAVQLTLSGNAVTLACDARVMSHATLPGEKRKKKAPKHSAYLPVALIDPILAAAPATLMSSDRAVGFRSGNASVWASLPARARDEFPTQTLMDAAASVRKAPLLARVPAVALAETCRAFAQYLISVPAPEWVLRLEGREDGVEVSAATSYVSFRDHLPGKAETGAATINLKALAPIAAFLETRPPEVEIRVSDSFCGIVAEGFEFFFARKQEADKK